MTVLGAAALVLVLCTTVYKVDYFVKSFLLSSLVLPNTRLSLNPTLRVLSYNIRT